MKLSSLLSGLALSSLLLAGCNQSSTTSGGGDASGPKPLHLAFVTNNAADFWTIARKGTEQAAKDVPNVTVDFLIPSQATAAEQKSIIDDLLTKGVDGIAMSPIDPANQIQMINDAAKQALIFTQDSDAPSSSRTCYIGTDNKAAGKQAGELIKQALPDGGKIMIFVGKKDAQNAQDRFEGIKEALEGSKVQIVDERTDGTDTVVAKSNVSDTLVTVPDIAGLVGLWSYNGPAILNAVKEADKIGKVKIVCFDEDPQTLAGVKSGAIYGTVVQQPFEFGRLAITNMAKVLRGDKSVVPADGRIIVPTLEIDKSKVDDFSAKLDELLGRTPAAGK
jgi:ribose transport system substrate-binding protein